MQRPDSKQTSGLTQLHQFKPGRRCTAKGSALIVSLIFLSVTSSLALTALEAAWSGQRMTSAYITYQQTLRALEQELRLAERRAWHQISSRGPEEFLLSVHNGQSSASSPLLSGELHWIDAGFSGVQCGPLFRITAFRSDQAGGQTGLSVYWDVCCENAESCLTSEFMQQRRRQSRWRQLDSTGQ